MQICRTMRYVVLLTPLIGLSPNAHSRQPESQSGAVTRVMSFNIRQGVADDGPNHWEQRKPLVAETIRRFDPDLLGTQETYAFQAEFLQKELANYRYFGRSRQQDPREGEQCGIFYRRDRFTWLAGGHFWLSETPEVPASKSWDSSLPRIASWVLLSDRQSSGQSVLFVNTHFDHRGRQARLESARLIRKRVQRLRQIADDPLVIVVGDFNCPEGSDPYLALLGNDSQWSDSYRSVHPERATGEGTFNGWQGRTEGGRIDWILASLPLLAAEADIDRWSSQDRYPSDHFPVTAVLKVQR